MTDFKEVYFELWIEGREENTHMLKTIQELREELSRLYWADTNAVSRCQKAMCQKCWEVPKKESETWHVDGLYKFPEYGYAGNSKAVDDAEKARVNQAEPEHGPFVQTNQKLEKMGNDLNAFDFAVLPIPTRKTESVVDKNTEESLRLLRWSIYEVIDSMAGDICKTIRIGLQMDVEKLFKEYTNS